jgi:lipopolysaccharide/colanic/teichoic acid biosynthesis glycosyltransferase
MQKIDAHPIQSHYTFSIISTLDSFARRTLDILAAAIGLILLAPLFGIIALSIKRDSPGPVFYRGPRLGRSGRPFGIIKFRTMYERPASYAGPRITGSGDTRITHLGRWLRATKLNELPQLWNVLIGEMSFVGPRPEDPEIAHAWPADLRDKLLSVRPGITSPATVVFRGEEEMLQSVTVLDDYLRSILPDKLRLDSLYIHTRTLITDLDVIFMTLALLMPRIRSMRVPETLLYWGPLAQFFTRIFNWFVVDTIVAFGAIGLAGLIWRADAPLNLGLQLAILIAIGVSLCFSIFNALFGLNRVQWRRASYGEIFPLALSTGIATLALIFFDIFFLRGDTSDRVGFHMPLAMLVVAGAFAYTGFIFLRYRERLITGFAARWLRARGPSSIGERILIIGAGNNSQFATWLFTHSDLSHAFSIIGIVDDDPRKQGMYYDGYPLIGTTRDLPALVERYNVGIILYTISNIPASDRRRILHLCDSTPARTVILPDIVQELTAQILDAKPSELSRLPAIGD